MSKSSKSRRRNSKRRIRGIPKPLILPLAVAGGMALIGITILIAATLNEEAVAGFTPTVTGAPSLEVEQAYFDLGDMHFNQQAETVFRLKNVGDQTLQILEAPQVQVVEGC